MLVLCVVYLAVTRVQISIEWFRLFNTNMKKIFLIIFFVLLSLVSNGQAPYSYSVVISEEGLSAEQLYDATKSWFAHAFKDSKAVLENQNPGKELIGKGSAPITFTGLSYKGMTGSINYTIDIHFREGRLKLDITNFVHTGQTVGYAYTTSMGLVLDSLPKDLKGMGGNFEKLQFRMNYKRFHKDAIVLCKATAYQLSGSLSNFIRNNKAKEEEDW